jgi:integrase
MSSAAIGRTLPMNEVLTATLQAVRMSVSVAGPVFRARTGEPYRFFRTALTHAVRQAGMIDFTFYDLRHIFASRQVMSGVDLPTGQALMGHKDISMTLRYTPPAIISNGRAVYWSPLRKSPHNFPYRREGRGQ